MFFLHIYKPPNINVAHLNRALEVMLNKTFTQGDTVYIIGDLNVNFMQKPNSLCNICDTYDLKQVIKNQVVISIV